VHVLEAYEWNRYIAPLIRNLSSRRRLVVNFMPWPLYHQGKYPNPHWIRGWVDSRASLEVLLYVVWKSITVQANIVLNSTELPNS